MFELAGRRVWIAGHAGLVGSAISRVLVAQGVQDLFGWRSSELDLTDRDATLQAARELRPDVVVLAAARVGGITSFEMSGPQALADNLRIQTNVMEAAAAIDVERLLLVGSAIVYPAIVGRPLTPDLIMTGPLDRERSAYAMSKLAGLMLLQSHRKVSRRRWIAVLPTNAYGPGDNFGTARSHVLPSLIGRLDEASREGRDVVTLWGSGAARRDLVHADDIASACSVVLRKYDNDAPINIGSGSDLSIAEVAQVVAKEVGFRGQIVWDSTRPDGVAQRLLDIRPLRSLGWNPSVSLPEGVRRSVEALRASGHN